MIVYLQIIQLILAGTLIVIILLQTREAGLGGVFGGEGAVYRGRRGVERTIFNITIILAVVFFLTSIITVILSG
ncbi:MAG: preprotein translocase subunit SecG [Anaerolineae bacterium]